MTNIHIWYNTDCTNFKFHEIPTQHHVSSHIRSDPLDKRYLTHILHTLTQREDEPNLHILVLTNRDVQIRDPELLIQAVNVIYQVINCREHFKLVCINLLYGKSSIIKQVKEQLIYIANKNRSLQSMRDLGRSLRCGDFISRSKLSTPRSRDVEMKIIQIINETIGNTKR
jgi:hypothetical protein